MSVLTKTPPRSTGWAATRWSLVSGLTDRADPKWQASWSFLAEGYRRPMELYARRLLARGPGGASSAQDAGDVVQSFLTTCVEKGWLSRADRDKGRFRAYVQVLLRKYVIRWLRHKLAKKRQPGDGQHLVPLLPDDQDLPEINPHDAEEFDRTWTEVAVERALATLRNENERYHMVIRDLIDTAGEGSPDMPERTELRAAQFPVLRHRARARFCGLFEDELRATVNDPEAFVDEWRALQAYMP